MSELKARHAFDVYEDYTKTGDDEQAQVYLQSEADDVISTIKAELDEYRYNLSCARNEINNLSISMKEDVKTIADKDKEIAELQADYKDALAKLEEQEAHIKEMEEAAADIGLKWQDYDAGEDAWEDQHKGKWVNAE